jgi:hypothetical protein
LLPSIGLGPEITPQLVPGIDFSLEEGMPQVCAFDRFWPSNPETKSGFRQKATRLQ